MMAMPLLASAQDFFSTRTVTKKTGRFSASVEFPTEGPREAVDSALQWMKAVMGVRSCASNDFNTILQVAADSFAVSGNGTSRSVKIERSYEDSGCVTFESMVTDKGGDTWHTADCASFSKADGHRITLGYTQDLDELLKCFGVGREIAVCINSSAVSGLVGDMTVDADAVAVSFRKDALVLHIDELILQRGAACVDNQD